MNAREELETLIGAQADEEAEESQVRLKGRSGPKPKPKKNEHDPRRQRWGYVPALDAAVRNATGNLDKVQPWEGKTPGECRELPLKPPGVKWELLPKRSPGR